MIPGTTRRSSHSFNSTFLSLPSLHVRHQHTRGGRCAAGALPVHAGVAPAARDRPVPDSRERPHRGRVGSAGRPASPGPARRRRRSARRSTVPPSIRRRVELPRRLRRPRPRWPVRAFAEPLRSLPDRRQRAAEAVGDRLQPAGAPARVPGAAVRVSQPGLPVRPARRADGVVLFERPGAARHVSTVPDPRRRAPVVVDSSLCAGGLTRRLSGAPSPGWGFPRPGLRSAGRPRGLIADEDLRAARRGRPGGDRRRRRRPVACSL